MDMTDEKALELRSHVMRTVRDWFDENREPGDRIQRIRFTVKVHFCSANDYVDSSAGCPQESKSPGSPPTQIMPPRP